MRVDCRAGRFTVVDLRVWGVEAAGVYLTDATARHVASYSDAEAAEFGTRLIRAAAAADGKELPDFEVKGMVTNWAVDPFAQGSFTAFTGPREEYSPLPPLSLPSSEQPYLVFAGEYNPPKGEGDIEMVGTVQGAWLSGVRAGEEAAIGFLDGN